MKDLCADVTGPDRPLYYMCCHTAQEEMNAEVMHCCSYRYQKLTEHAFCHQPICLNRKVILSEQILGGTQ